MHWNVRKGEGMPKVHVVVADSPAFSSALRPPPPTSHLDVGGGSDHVTVRPSRLFASESSTTLSFDLFFSAFQQGKHLIKVFDGWSPTVEDRSPPIRFVLTRPSRAFGRRRVCSTARICSCAQQHSNDAPVAVHRPRTTEPCGHYLRPQGGPLPSIEPGPPRHPCRRWSSAECERQPCLLVARLGWRRLLSAGSPSSLNERKLGVATGCGGARRDRHPAQSISARSERHRARSLAAAELRLPRWMPT